MTGADQAAGYRKIKHILGRLLDCYFVHTQGTAGWYWTDPGARDAYYLICDLWRMRRQG